MLCFALLALACAPADRPLVAEILYDPAGDDAGHEFVELYAPGAAPWSLAGLRLEAGDGSGAGRWTLRWTGTAADTVAAGGRFVIGGAEVVPAPRAVATLDLQNGPDALRLVWPDGVVEVVGWGAHEFAEYACGAPAADAPSGSSLARVPDAAATGSNAGDFRAAPPSPGSPNQVERNLAFVSAPVIEPEQPEPGTTAIARATVANTGRVPAEAHAARVVSWLGEARAGEAVLETAIAAGESLAIAAPVMAAAPGVHELRLVVELSGDGRAADDTARVRVRVGPGPLEITEIQFHPAAGEGEWVELRNRSGAPLDPADFTLADRADRGATIAGAGLLAPDSLAVIAQDRDALLAARPELAPRAVWEARPWPALNNSDDPSGRADAVIVRGRDGTPCARADYPASGVPDGQPVERDEGGPWVAALAPGGTPGAPPLRIAAAGAPFELDPPSVARGAAVALRWRLPWSEALVTLELYDLAGVRVAVLLPETTVGRRGERRVRVGPARAGTYVALLTARERARAAPLIWTRVLRVEAGP